MRASEFQTRLQKLFHNVFKKKTASHNNVWIRKKLLDVADTLSKNSVQGTYNNSFIEQLLTIYLTL